MMMRRLRLTDPELVACAGATYSDLVSKADAAPVVLDALLQFKSSLLKMAGATFPIRRLHRDMDDDASGLRAYMRERAPAYDRALSLDMDFRELRGVLKRHAIHTNDRSNGWGFSTPLNVVLFFQLYKLTGEHCWRAVCGAAAPRSKPAVPKTSVPKAVAEEDQSHCVYAILNHAELNAAGAPMIYVGRSGDLVRRLREHQSPNSQCKLIRNAIQRDGFHNMTVKVLVVGHPDAIRRSETAAIARFGCVYPHGYNLRCGDTAALQEECALAVADAPVEMEELEPSMQVYAQLLAVQDVQALCAPPSEDRGQGLLCNQ